MNDIAEATVEETEELQDALTNPARRACHVYVLSEITASQQTVLRNLGCSCLIPDTFGACEMTRTDILVLHSCE